MANLKPVVFLVVAAAAVAGAWWALRTTPEEAPKPPPPAAAPQRPEPSKSPVMTVDFVPEPEAKVPVERRLKMPDGSFVPTLNGVVNPAPLAWGDVPYSPIVRKQIDPTLEWYVHADGSYTTTIMVWRSELGRNDACTYSLHPTKPAPTEPVVNGEGATKKQ